MRQFLKIGLGGAASLALVITFAVGRSPSPAQDRRAFEAWAERLADDQPLKKADQIRVVTTERIVVEPIVQEVAVPTKVPPMIRIDDDERGEKPKRRKYQRVRVAEANVCTRHHMRKVEVNGGRSWRCKK